MLIGMFHVRKDPESVSRAYLCAAAAKLEGMDFVYFIASDVNFENNTINGHFYENGRWQRKLFPFPDVFINIIRPRSEKQLQVYNRLRRMIPYTTFNVGSKIEVYKKIIAGKQYISHLIPYEPVGTVKDILIFMNEHPEVIIKPVIGNHGNDICYLRRRNDQYFVLRDQKEETYTITSLKTFLEKIINNKPMIVQKYINCRTKEGIPFDIRLHLQKDGEGQWQITFIQPKVGTENQIVTNVAKGGSVPPLNRFMYQQFGLEAEALKRKLSRFALEFTRHFEDQYEYNFDALGIDIGIDENQQLWIYEVNSRPGQSFTEGKAAKWAVTYAKYVAENERGE